MNDVTKRGLNNALLLLFQSAEFDRLRQFLQADASGGGKEAEEIIKVIGDQVRDHLVTHGKALAAIKRGI